MPAASDTATLTALSPAERRALERAVLDAFPSYSELKIALSAISVHLPEVVSDQQPLTVVVSETVRWAQSRARLGEVIQALVQERPGVDALHVCLDQWRATQIPADVVRGATGASEDAPPTPGSGPQAFPPGRVDSSPFPTTDRPTVPPAPAFSASGQPQNVGTRQPLVLGIVRSHKVGMVLSLATLSAIGLATWDASRPPAEGHWSCSVGQVVRECSIRRLGSSLTLAVRFSGHEFYEGRLDQLGHYSASATLTHHLDNVVFESSDTIELRRENGGHAWRGTWRGGFGESRPQVHRFELWR